MNRRNRSIPPFSSVVQTLPTADRPGTIRHELRFYRRNRSIPPFSSVVQTFPAADRPGTKQHELKSYRRNRIIYTFRLLSLCLKPLADQKATGIITHHTDGTSHYVIIVCKFGLFLGSLIPQAQTISDFAHSIRCTSPTMKCLNSMRCSTRS